MKHLIIFLDYNSSRLENPVYRILAAQDTSAKETALLFVPGKLEERDLNHQVNELRQKEEGVDITFHICNHAASDCNGEHVISTIRLIRKQFFPTDGYSYPIFIYSRTEEIPKCNPNQKKILWNYLVALNKVAIKYYDCTLVNGIYLYHDATQNSLADYLYFSIRSGIPAQVLSSAIEENAPKQWAPVFGSLNACGLSYPESEIRRYLHFYHLQTVLRYSRSENNPIDMEACIRLANNWAMNIPMATERICLQEESFLKISEENSPRWMPVKDFWNKEIEKAFEGLSDIPRQAWLNKIDKVSIGLYQNRFRQVGVEYFFKLQEKKTDEYCQVLLAIITEQFEYHIQNTPFTPEAFKTVIHALVNILQQKLLEIQQRAAQLKPQLEDPARQLKRLEEAWDKLTIINRMMGKDKQILEQYKQTLILYYTSKTQWAGYRFAIKLLNELITHTTALKDKCDKLEEKLQSALHMTDAAVSENNPIGLFGIFDSGILSETETAISQNKNRLLADYSEILKKFTSSTFSTGGDDLSTSLVLLFREKWDEYLDSAIEKGLLPPVLNVNIIDRIRQIYKGKGGIESFLRELKNSIPIQLKIKDSDILPATSEHNRPTERNNMTKKFLLISPSAEQEWSDETFCLNSPNTIGLIHVCYGLRLTQLEGFSGQRVTFEPTIF